MQTQAEAIKKLARQRRMTPAQMRKIILQEGLKLLTREQEEYRRVMGHAA